MHEFEILEQAVITALQPLKTGGGLKTLEVYAGQAEADDIEELARMTAFFPCIYVVATGLIVEAKSRFDDEDIGVMLIVGDKNLRGIDAARRGDINSPGVYDLLDQSRSLLHRKVITTGWPAMRLEKAVPLYLAPKKGICIYAAHYRIGMVK
jgi:phage gp37-like protein